MVNETAQVRILAVFFFFCFYMYVWKCDEGFVHFLHTVAKDQYLTKRTEYIEYIYQVWVKHETDQNENKSR